VTTPVDSAGFDLTGVRRTVTHDNPLTRPFFVKSAEAGDALEVRIGRIRLNRTTGYTGHQVGLKETPPVGKPGADRSWSSRRSRCWGASVLRRRGITLRDRGRPDTGRQPRLQSDP